MKNVEKLRRIYEALGNIVNDLDNICSDEHELLISMDERDPRYEGKELTLGCLEHASADVGEAYEIIESILEDEASEYTKEEIIEALKCHIDRKCGDCPLHENGKICRRLMFNGVLKYLNEQEAELMGLSLCLNEVVEKGLKLRIATINDFTEKLKKKTYPFPRAIGVEHAVTIRAIDDLAKEMIQEAESDS